MDSDNQLKEAIDVRCEQAVFELRALQLEVDYEGENVFVPAARCVREPLRALPEPPHHPRQGLRLRGRLDVHRRRQVEGHTLEEGRVHVHRAGDETVGGHLRPSDAKGRSGRRGGRAVDLVALQILKPPNYKAQLAALRARGRIGLFGHKDRTGRPDDLTVERDLDVDG